MENRLNICAALLLTAVICFSGCGQPQQSDVAQNAPSDNAPSLAAQTSSAPDTHQTQSPQEESPAASEQNPYEGLIDALPGRQQDGDRLRRLIAEFSPDECTVEISMYYGDYDENEMGSHIMSKQAAAEALAILRTAEFILPPTGGDEGMPGSWLMDKWWELIITQGESSLTVTVSPHLVFTDGESGEMRLFSHDAAAAELEALVDSLTVALTAENRVVSWQEISGRMDEITDGGWGDAAELESYREVMASLSAADITAVEAGVFGYEGGHTAVTPQDTAPLLSLLRSTGQLAVFDPDISRNPPTGGTEYARIFYQNGGELLFGFNGEWLFVSAPGIEGVATFDASAYAGRWADVMGELRRFTFEPEPPGPPSWCYNAFVEMGISDGIVAVYDDVAKLSWPIHHSIREQSRLYMVENAIDGGTPAGSEDLGGLWSETLTIGSIHHNDDIRMLNDNRYAMRLYEHGIEMTRSNWRTGETETARLAVGDDCLEPLKKLCLERNGLPKAFPLWLAMMSGARVTKIEINDGESTISVRDDMILGSQSVMRSVMFPVSGPAAVREKGSAPQGEYTVAISFNNGVRYDIAVTGAELYIESSDVGAALSYRLADPETTLALLRLEHSQLINPAT